MNDFCSMAIVNEIANLSKHLANPNLHITRTNNVSESTCISTLRNVNKLLLDCTQKVLEEKARKSSDMMKDASSNSNDVDYLRNRAIHLQEVVRAEKRLKRAAEDKAASGEKKIEMLADHIEKLMKALRNESACRHRAMIQVKESRENYLVLLEKNMNLEKAAGSQKNLIRELREGSKVLEDQLRLMDEKFLALKDRIRVMSDYQKSTLARSKKESHDLRLKLATLSPNFGANLDFTCPYCSKIVTPATLKDQTETSWNLEESAMMPPNSPKSLRSSDEKPIFALLTPSTRPATADSYKGRRSREGFVASKKKIAMTGSSSTPEFHDQSNRKDPNTQLDNIIKKIYLKKARHNNEWSDDHIQQLLSDH